MLIAFALLSFSSYLEARDHDGLVRPWVWILWLAGGPLLKSVFAQWRTYITASTSYHRLPVKLIRFIVPCWCKARNYLQSAHLQPRFTN